MTRLERALCVLKLGLLGVYCADRRVKPALEQYMDASWSADDVALDFALRDLTAIADDCDRTARLRRELLLDAARLDGMKRVPGLDKVGSAHYETVSNKEMAMSFATCLVFLLLCCLAASLAPALAAWCKFFWLMGTSYLIGWIIRSAARRRYAERSDGGRGVIESMIAILSQLAEDNVSVYSTEE